MYKTFNSDIGKFNRNKQLKEFIKYQLYIYIPKNDTSSRSEYECILCGGVVDIIQSKAIMIIFLKR